MINRVGGGGVYCRGYSMNIIAMVTQSYCHGYSLSIRGNTLHCEFWYFFC